jgi:DNA-directed RNA polymerase specialized sigma24 family protein
MSMKPSVREWPNGWTRRVLVQNAIEMLRPSVVSDEQLVNCNLGLKPALHAAMRLKKFERFVFVLSILEGYSDRECSLLLGPSARDIMAAKVRALENLAANLKELLACPSSLDLGAERLTDAPRVANVPVYLTES